MAKSKLKELCDLLQSNQNTKTSTEEEYVINTIKSFTHNDTWTLNLILEKASSESISNLISILTGSMSLLTSCFSLFVSILAFIHSDSWPIGIILTSLVLYDVIGCVLLFRLRNIFRWRETVIIAIKKILFQVPADTQNQRKDEKKQ